MLIPKSACIIEFEVVPWSLGFAEKTIDPEFSDAKIGMCPLISVNLK